MSVVEEALAEIARLRQRGDSLLDRSDPRLASPSREEREEATACYEMADLLERLANEIATEGGDDGQKRVP